MSIEMMRYVWKSETPKHLPRLVLLAMADAANDDGWCWTSIHTLHKKTRISERYLRSLVGKLHEDGHIRVYGRFDPDTQSQTSNVYFIEHGQLEEPKLPTDLKGKIARTMHINKPVKAGQRRGEASSRGVGSVEHGGGEADSMPPMKRASDESLIDPSGIKEFSAAKAAGKPKATRAERNALTNAMGEHLFGLTSQSSINMAASRINGLIKMVSADKLPTPDDVAAFVVWYKRQCPGASLPTGNDTFPSWWAQWVDRAARKPARPAGAVTYDASNPPPIDSIPTRPDVPQDPDLAEFLRSRSEVMYG